MLLQCKLCRLISGVCLTCCSLYLASVLMGVLLEIRQGRANDFNIENEKETAQNLRKVGRESKEFIR